MPKCTFILFTLIQSPLTTLISKPYKVANWCAPEIPLRATRFSLPLRDISFYSELFLILFCFTWLFSCSINSRHKNIIIKVRTRKRTMHILTYDTYTILIQIRKLLTWNRRMSLGLPAFLRQFWLHFRKNLRKNLQ